MDSPVYRLGVAIRYTFFILVGSLAPFIVVLSVCAPLLK